MSEKLKCTFAGCSARATRIMASPALTIKCMYVAAYCDAHPSSEDRPGYRGADAVPAAGPALSEQAQKIGGIR